MPYLSVKVGRPRLDSLFSPAGRRWPEGSDEGATRHTIHCPSLALRLPFACAQRIRGFAAHPLNRLPAPSPRWGEETCRTRLAISP
ncbi:hypothetical protein ELI00_23625 [Rhizobium ruizarguesonis]|nr:hypothetical protein ELI00_23625 [Rhizobium ruizarguesonis]